ncbi:hypothetical protein D3C73_1308930 [compost metagenome]
MAFIPGHIQFSKYRFRLPQLTFATVDQNNVRDLTCFNRLAITAAQHLIHRCIIIAGGNAGNIIAAVFST